MNKGINFKTYYNLLKNLDEKNTEGLTRSEYKKEIINLFAKELSNNFMNGHIYPENITLDTRNHFGKFKIEYYPTCSNSIHTMYIDFRHDYVCVNSIYIKY